MSDMWCQNKRCAEKKTKNQIRGSKGKKYYQSNKATGYYEYWCSTGCRDQWFSDNRETALRAVGIIEKQTIQMEDAWYIDAKYDWNSSSDGNTYIYTLRNMLLGIKQPITKQQAQTQVQFDSSSNWQTKNDDQAKELAMELGLIKQVA